jgi:hypothetical protein
MMDNYFQASMIALEVSALQRSTTDETAVDVRLSEELLSVAGLAATAIEDGSVLSSLFAVLLSNDSYGCKPASPQPGQLVAVLPVPIAQIGS